MPGPVGGVSRFERIDADELDLFVGCSGEAGQFDHSGGTLPGAQAEEEHSSTVAFSDRLEKGPIGGRFEEVGVISDFESISNGQDILLLARFCAWPNLDNRSIRHYLYFRKTIRVEFRFLLGKRSSFENGGDLLEWRTVSWRKLTWS